MASDILGIEIGTHSTKIVEVKNGQIRNYIYTETPENAVGNEGLIAFEAMGQTLKEALQEHHIRTRKTAIVLPDVNVYLHKVTLPVMNEKQLAVNLPYEFHDMIQGDKDSYLYDYVVTHIEKKDGIAKEMELLAAAVEKRVVEDYTEMCKRIGLRLVRLEPRQLSLACLMREMHMEEAEKDVMFLDLGENETVLDMYRNTVYDTSRTMDTGLVNIVEKAADILHCDRHIARKRLETSDASVLDNPEIETIYNDIAVETMRAINYYMYENQDTTVEKVYYYGGGSGIPQFIHTIQDTISLKLVPLSSIGEDSDVLMHAPAAYGITLEK